MHVVRRRLADGTVKEYRYGAHQPRRERYAPETIGALVIAYKASPEWARLAESTKTTYLIYLREIEEIGQVPAADFRRRDVLSMRDALVATRGTGAATGFIRATSALFAWAVDREWLEHSPVHRIKSLPETPLPAWSERDLALALDHLPEHLRRPVQLALYTGQRRSDLVKLRWSDDDGTHLHIVQQKTGTVLDIPVHPELRALLAAWKKEATTLTVLAGPDGKPWVPARLTERLARALAKIEGGRRGLNIHGVRKLHAAQLAEGGATTNQIAAMTGHRTLSMVAHYTASADQKRLAGAAILRLKTKPRKREKVALKD